MKLWGLPRIISDHCPLQIMEDVRDWGPKPFRFLNAWTPHPNFSQLFVSFWSNTTFAGWFDYILFQKLKHLKLILKSWNIEVFGNITSKIKSSEEELHALDIIAKERALVASEKARRRVVRGEMWKLYRMVEWIWHKKSRLNWTLNGDENTRFFHVANTRPIFNFFVDNCVIKVGNGNRIRFWFDRWCGALCLKSAFPLLFNISYDKEGSLHQYFARKSSPSAWNLPHRRELYPWELAEEERLIDILSSAPSLCLDSEDCQVWSIASAGQFSVSALYSHSSSFLGPHLRICKCVWNSILPFRVSFFCWLAWKNRIKCSDFLLNIGFLDSNASPLCHFCCSALEFATHVLLYCPFSWSIWSAIIEEWGFYWCIPKSADDLLTWWISGKFQKFERSIWRAIPLIVIWSIWKYKNECVFCNAQPNSSDLPELIKFKSALWLKVSIKNFPYTVDDLVFKWRQIRGSA
ncbi:hypothetical protein ACSBR1_034063 [Camellia fascicularis]